MHFYMPTSIETALLRLRRLKIGSYCVLCNRRSLQNIDICLSCQKWLVPRIKQIGLKPYFLCVHCGVEVGGVDLTDAVAHPFLTKNMKTHNYACHNCQLISAKSGRLIVPYRYEFPISHMIKRLKYGRQRVLGRVLGELLASHVHRAYDSYPDLVVPVPLHHARQKSRGFNQAAEIAKWCSNHLDIKFQPHAIKRINETTSLAGLSRAERQLQILGAFEARKNFTDCRVAIVDDVVTSGATTRELKRELYDSGAALVDIWAVARTSMGDHSPSS